MDSIFRKTKNVFSVVRTAKEEPRRFGKNGEVLIRYEETDERWRRASASASASVGKMVGSES